MLRRLKSLPKLSEGDKAIFARAKQENNASFITNFYLRNADSGTYWRPVNDKDIAQLEMPQSIEIANRWKTGYEKLYTVWENLHHPDYFGIEGNDWSRLRLDAFKSKAGELDQVYRVIFDADSPQPVFHYPHGIQLLPWQLEMDRCKLPIAVVVGGYGCIAGETKILDAETDQYIRVDELFRQQKPIKVYAWNGKSFIKAQASTPWVKGITDLYKVTFKSGKSITVTLNHRFLTPLGWKHLRDLNVGCHILAYESDLEIITAIDYQRCSVFYDITVPHYENYVAEGVVNHNSAKTFGKLLSMLARAITLPGYRALALAPFSKQAQEVHTIALQIIQGTIFEKFLIAAPVKPYPQLIFGNDYVGTTSIECFSCDDPSKFLTLTVDEALVDQAELVDGNGTATIEELVRSLGTRFRGQVRGRARVGQITLVANSGDNPQLWDLYDEGITDPNYVWAKSPKTHENIYLTIPDLLRYEKVVGRDDASRRMYLLGERPIGSGEHFPQESLEKCRAKFLDERMTVALNNKEPGWLKLDAPRVATYRWEMPPQEDHRYIVTADVGWADAPDRNAAVVAVWDITTFPTTPAIMTAFHWVSGGGSPNPWIAQYIEYVNRYKAIGLNGYDSTGTGAGYERMDAVSMLLPTPINMGGANKMIYLNLTKKLMADGKLQMPSITHLFSQCAKYTLPDDKLRQDIVMMLLVTSAMLELFALYPTNTEPVDVDYDPHDRWYRPQNNRDNYDIYPRTER